MASLNMRRSERRRVRPVEFWNFVKPEDSVNETVTYKESELSRCSVFKPFSMSYSRTPKRCPSNLQGNLSKVPRITEKKSKGRTLTAENLSHSNASVARKRTVKDTEPQGKVTSHPSSASDNATHPSKLSRKDGHKDGTKTTKSNANLIGPKQTPSTDQNQTIGLQIEGFVGVGRGDAHSTEENERMRQSEQTLSSSSDNSSALKKSGRKRKMVSEEPEENNVGSILVPNGEVSLRKPVRTFTGENEHSVNQGSAGLGLPPNITFKHPASFRTTTRHNHNHQKSNLVTTVTTPQATAKDITQNVTAYEQPSFQNVFSSTAIDAPGKSVFKVPRLPSFRRHPLAALRISSLCLDPSMETIPEEEEGQEQKEGERLKRSNKPVEEREKQKEERLERNSKQEMGDNHHMKKKEKEGEKNSCTQEGDEAKKKREKNNNNQVEKKQVETQEQVNEEKENNEQKNKTESELQKKPKQKEQKKDRIEKARSGETASGDDDGDVTARSNTQGAAVTKPLRKKTSAVPLQPQRQEVTAKPTQDNTRMEVTTNCRRSSRIRMNPLEFWNFEEVKVQQQEDGEVRIIHQKQDPVNLNIKRREVDCSMVGRSQLSHGVSLTANILRDTQQTHRPQSKTKDITKASKAKRRQKISPIKLTKEKKKEATDLIKDMPQTHRQQTKTKDVTKASKAKEQRKISPIKVTKEKKGEDQGVCTPSPGKRSVDTEQILSSMTPEHAQDKTPTKKLVFSPQDDFLDNPVEEEGRFRKKTKAGILNIKIKKFKDLQFMVLEREAYCCYLAQGIQLKDQSIYTGYVFLQRGQIVWNTTRETTVFIIEGYGGLQCVGNGYSNSFSLKPRETLKFEDRLKMLIKKDGRCKLLKLHIVLGSLL